MDGLFDRGQWSIWVIWFIYEIFSDWYQVSLNDIVNLIGWGYDSWVFEKDKKW